MTLTEGKTYIVARSGNNRPTLQHRLAFHFNGSITTLCGRDISRWSRAYLTHAIPEIMCRRCTRLGG